jgi:hypothetical protein
MAKTPPKHGKDWSAADVAKMQRLAKQNTPTGLIAYELGRTKAAIQGKASSEGVSLKPTNKSPYNRRK